MFFLFAILVSCNEDVEQQAELDMSLCIPANEVVHRAGGPRRVMGDPGTSEQFDLPKYVYIFVLKQEGDVWSVWRKEERTLTDADWKRTRYGGQNATRGDSIFKYNEKIRYYLVGEKIKGRIYAICSNKKLTFYPSFGSISNLDEVLGLKFSTAPDSIQENLHNIYSTPYNYERSGSYYCSFDCMAGNTAVVDMLLYHVAAKVDIKWNVAEEKRIDRVTPANGVRLTYMEARRLFNGNAYCFKPMCNTMAELPTSGYAIKNIVTPTDEGLWWEGRSYFYTIPYTTEESGKENYFPLQMLMVTNDSGNEYKPTIYMQIDKTSPFVPWLRANFNISAPLPIDSPTKTVNN